MMINEFFFQFYVSEEQKEYASQLVEYSILNHPVADIFSSDPNGKERQREFRFTGTLGEVVFADSYNLERPKRSFGAIDGQDNGQDFLLNINGKQMSCDVKSMGRKNNNFRENYVLNLPKYQMDKDSVVTDYYFCISLHKDFKNKYIASFIGYVSKSEIQNGKIGILYEAGTKRIKDDGGYFTFQRDTYEIDFKDISTPILNDSIRKLDGFLIKTIQPPFNK
ncbi:hypothetical protein [Dyadobacter sp. 3J3]|uniref:hypothetical protein n=1 Tax=Dyadobacter sp. 3J3 TaxID=2606600 RepID=UPI0013585CB5|nr:hypothetical protein [Dyadobacter sp. 3J3]